MSVIAKSFKRGFAKLFGMERQRINQLSGYFPSKAYSHEGDLVVQLTGANFAFLQNNGGEIDWSLIPEYAEWVRVQALGEHASKIKAGEIALEVSDYEYKTDPYDHQLKAFELSKDLTSFGYFMEMGCGKSKVLIDNIAYLHERGLLDTVLIFAPNGVHVQWIDEQLPVHMPDRIDYASAYYRADLRAKERDALKAALEDTEKLRIITMNVESLSNKSGFKFAFEFLNSSQLNMMAVDESQKIKTPSSGRTRNAQKLGKMCKYRRLLSGTPITKGVEDLFAPMKFLDQNILGYSSFITFKQRYCIMQPNPFSENSLRIVGYRDIDHLQSKMDGYTYRVTKNDCLSLPPKVYDNRCVDMLPAQRRAYNQLKEELMTELEDGTFIQADFAIVKLLRLHQIACGHAPMEDGENYTWVVEPKKNPKVQVVLDLIDEAQGPVIIWCRFTADIMALCEVINAQRPNILYQSYFGATDNNARDEIIRDFKAGKVDVLIANPAAAGTGLNLTQSNTVIYFSNSFNAEYRWQSEDRTHRIGQDNKVTYYDLIARDTIDKNVIANLKKKKSIADMTIDGIKELIE